MRREFLERKQVWVYLIAIILGLTAGKIEPALGPTFERLLWPGLAVLLYTTFTQVPLNRLPEAFKDSAFISAVLLGNFVVLPILVFAVLMLTPDDPAIRLGLLLVLLVPCTDWFVTFAHQAGGDLHRAIAVTPVLLLAQMLLLPLYLWLFMGKEFTDVVSAGRMVRVFAVVLVIPLVLAWLSERWAKKNDARVVLLERLGVFPVPLLAFVLFLIAASQVEAVLGSLSAMGSIFIACLAFLMGATASGLIIGRLFRLSIPQARTLVFTLATRNSFVVLPFALALPAGFGMASITIVFQSLTELFGMLVLLWLVPKKLLPSV